MAKSITKASTKSKKSASSSSILLVKQESQQYKIDLSTVDEKEQSEIKIKIESFQNIAAIYPSSYIYATCEYAGQHLGQTENILMTDDPLVTVNHTFNIKCDIESPEELDRLISGPAIIKLFQFPRLQSNVFVQREQSETEKLVLDDDQSSIESAISLYEALTGDTVEKVNFVRPPPSSSKKFKNEKKEKKEKKESKIRNKKITESDEKLSKISSKESKKSRTSDKKESKTSSQKDSSIDSQLNKSLDEDKVNVIEIGVSVLDLSPLVLDNSNFSQFAPIISPKTSYDDRMTRHLLKPGIHITIFMDESLQWNCKPNLLNVTLDAIYNIPKIMNEEMEYSVCIVLPSVNQPQKPILIKNGQHVSTSLKPERKQWPDIPNVYYNLTTYRSNYDPNTIKNCVGKVDLTETLLCKDPRILFNTIKRNLLLKEGFFALYDQIKKIQQVVIEIFAIKGKTEDVENHKSKVKSKEEKSEKPYLHLMAIIDLSPLLYPGVTRLRTAVPITTFHKQEAFEAGLEQSYFLSSDNKPLEQINPKDNESSKKSDTTDKRKEERDLNLKKKLPPQPVNVTVPEPSVKVYSEDGKPTFIIVEIELSKPMVKKQEIDDLHDNLKNLIQLKPKIPKVTFNNQLVAKFYNDVLSKVINEANRKYSTYVELKKLCRCEQQDDFLTYLRRTSIYQDFVVAIAHIASLIAQFRLNMLDTQYNFVEETFMYLMTETNQVLHKLTTLNRNFVETPKKSTDSLLFYAKEATELGKQDLAEKYYLERIHHNPNNPDFWFDFAVYKIHCDECGKAFECVQEALSNNLYHRNSLLLSGILLTEKKRLEDAELCLLTLMVHEPRWVEGWVVLYLFYKETENIGGMDLAMEMALKYFDDPRSLDDYFVDTDDLAWTSSICPRTLYFRVSVLLLKMRIYSWVENALAYELKETGIVHYMLAVICYYKKNYEHALEHIKRARQLHGSDYAVVSLAGHCFLALGEQKKALEEYSIILGSPTRPDDMHLLYLNCAQTTDSTQARKLLLLACKNHPTPYAWMCGGIAYLKEKDFISAEECFSESILLDNSSAECWGYLTLTNLLMMRSSEAELCYALALKNDLKNKCLQEEILKEFKKVNQK